MRFGSYARTFHVLLYMSVLHAYKDAEGKGGTL